MVQDKISAYRAELTTILKPSIYLSVAAGVLLFIALLVKESFEINQKMIEASLIVSGTLSVFNLLLIGLCTYFYKITIYKDGLSSYNPWEFFKCYQMNWSDMKELRLKSVFGYKYYYLCSSDQLQCLWVPYDIKNKKAFYSDLLGVVNQDNILIKNIKIT